MKKTQPKSNRKSQLAQHLRELALRQRKSQLAPEFAAPAPIKRKP
jgi:hypothetical protein